MLTEFGGIALAPAAAGHMGLHRVRRRRRNSRAQYERAARGRAQPRSAGGLLLHAVQPTRIRKRTVCSMPTARRRFRSARSPQRQRGPAAPRTGGLEQVHDFSREPVEAGDAQACAHQAGRPRADACTRGEPMPDDLDAPSPSAGAARAESAPALASAPRRMGRVRQPSPAPDVSSAAGVQPTRAEHDPGHPTEVPAGPWDVAVFENLFPTCAMTRARPAGALRSDGARAWASARSSCSRRTRPATLGTLPLWHLELLIDVWADRYEELGRVPKSRTSSRSRIAAWRSASRCTIRTGRSTRIRSCRRSPARELEQQRAYYERHGRGLLEDMIGSEMRRGHSAHLRGRTCAAFMPVCAGYSYEVWVAPDGRRASFAALTREERADFARALKTVLLKFDGLWSTPVPLHSRVPSGADRRAAASRSASPRRVLSRVSDAGPPEVPRGQRDRRRRFHRRHRARRGRSRNCRPFSVNVDA